MKNFFKICFSEWYPAKQHTGRAAGGKGGVAAYDAGTGG